MSRKFIVTAAAAALVAAPIGAQAAPDRAAAATAGEQEQLFGPVIVPILIAIPVAIGIWLAVDGDDNPVSP